MRTTLSIPARLLLVLALAITALAYWPGLSGGFAFDDFPNIVDNPAVQPETLSLASMSAAALSSPSSRFKRPLASVSFAGNYLLTGLDPFWMKLTNLAIHLANGALIFLLALCLLKAIQAPDSDNQTRQPEFIAACIAAGWLALPINLTAVLYVVQRMESLAHLFVFAGLIGYCHGRMRMLNGRAGAWLACASVLSGTALGLLAKETAILLPLYAALIEGFIFRFRRPGHKSDVRLIGFFICILAVPLGLGLIWQLGIVLNPAIWLFRDFNLSERLLSEARIVLIYIKWTLLPLPWDLSFYHDDIEISRSLFSPWTTIAAIAGLAAMAATIVTLRNRQPLVALGLALYLGAHTLTATILPLELVYEHRNYFASYGLLLAIIPWLCNTSSLKPRTSLVLLCVFYLAWLATTSWSAKAWGHPITLAQELAARAPESPRAQYALARTYLIASNYEPESPYLAAALPILERTAAMPHASILPESALIYTHSKLDRPVPETWWRNLLDKLEAKRPDVQDEAAIMALARCARETTCQPSIERMIDMFLAALTHPNPSARVLAAYGDYAWNVLEDRALALRLARDATHREPGEPTYLLTLLRMQLALGQNSEAKETLKALENLNILGRLNHEFEKLARESHRPTAPPAPANGKNEPAPSP